MKSLQLFGWNRAFGCYSPGAKLCFGEVQTSSQRVCEYSIDQESGRAR